MRPTTNTVHHEARDTATLATLSEFGHVSLITTSRRFAYPRGEKNCQALCGAASMLETVAFSRSEGQASTEVNHKLHIRSSPNIHENMGTVSAAKLKLSNSTTRLASQHVNHHVSVWISWSVIDSSIPGIWSRPI